MGEEGSGQQRGLEGARGAVSGFILSVMGYHVENGLWGT